MPKFKVKLEEVIDAVDEYAARELFWEMAIGCGCEPGVLEVEVVDAKV